MIFFNISYRKEMHDLDLKTPISQIVNREYNYNKLIMYKSYCYPWDSVFFWEILRV